MREEHDIRSLPRWAQTEIEELEDANIDLGARLDERKRKHDGSGVPAFLVVAAILAVAAIVWGVIYLSTPLSHHHGGRAHSTSHGSSVTNTVTDNPTIKINVSCPSDGIPTVNGNG